MGQYLTMSPLIHICILICLLPNLLEATKSNSKLSKLRQIYSARERREPQTGVAAGRGRERRGRGQARGRVKRGAETGSAGERIIRIMIAPPPPHQVGPRTSWLRAYLPPPQGGSQARILWRL